MGGVSASKLKELARKFPDEQTEWKIQTVAGEWALVVPYITARAVQDRLDEVCGPENWYNEYRPISFQTVDDKGQVRSESGQMCGITIITENGPVTKWNGADNTATESVKGGISDSEKRAAVEWGIGRYLYDVDNRLLWVKFTIGSDKTGGSEMCIYNKQKHWFTAPKIPGWNGPVKTETPPETRTESVKQTVKKAGSLNNSPELEKWIGGARKNQAITENQNAIAILDAVRLCDGMDWKTPLNMLSTWATSAERNGVDGTAYLVDIFMEIGPLANHLNADGRTVKDTVTAAISGNKGLATELLKQIREQVLKLIKERE